MNDETKARQKESYLLQKEQEQLTQKNSDQKDEIKELKGKISNLKARTALTEAAAEKEDRPLKETLRLTKSYLKSKKTELQEYTSNRVSQIIDGSRERLECLIDGEKIEANNLRIGISSLGEQIEALEPTVSELETQYLEEQSKSSERLFEETRGVFSTLELVSERANGHDEAKTQYDSNMKKTLRHLRKLKPYKALKFSLTLEEESILKKDDYRENVSDIIEAYIPTRDWSQFDEEVNDLTSKLKEVHNHLEWIESRKKIENKIQKIKRLLKTDGERIVLGERKMSKVEIEYLDNKIGMKSGIRYEGGATELDGKYNFTIFECDDSGEHIGDPIVLVNEKSNPFRHTFRHLEELEKLHMEELEIVEYSPLPDERWNELKSEEEQTQMEWLIDNEILYRIHQHLDEETYTQLRESYFDMKEKEYISLSDIENLGYGGNTQ